LGTPFGTLFWSLADPIGQSRTTKTWSNPTFGLKVGFEHGFDDLDCRATSKHSNSCFLVDALGRYTECTLCQPSLRLTRTIQRKVRAIRLLVHLFGYMLLYTAARAAVLYDRL